MTDNGTVPDLLTRLRSATGPEHNYYYNHPKGFLVINDGPLTMEPIEQSDLTAATIDPALPYASWAWSSDCRFYFVVGGAWIALFHVAAEAGVICRKKSAEFIRLYLEEPEKLKIAALSARNPA